MRRRPVRPTTSLAWLVAVAAGASLAACGDGGEPTAVASTDAVTTSASTTTSGAATSTTSPPTTLAPTTTVAPTTSTTAAPTTLAPTTTAAPTTLAPPPPPPPTLPPLPAMPLVPVADATVVETRQVGTSVEGRPIDAVRRGTPGGRVVLVIGVIHGDENDGLAIVDRLLQWQVPAGIDLWVIDSMNPDGVAADDRHNANQVDLNRNFPYNWGPIGEPGFGQYAGPGPASEPETQAIVSFITEIRPDLVVWYHQDLYRISPGSGRDGAIRARYAELTGLPVIDITGGIYTGVAATWARHTISPGVAFIVELGGGLTDYEADLHAAAVLTVASEPN